MIRWEQVPREHRHMFSFSSGCQNKMEAVIKAGSWLEKSIKPGSVSLHIYINAFILAALSTGSENGIFPLNLKLIMITT